MPDGPLAAYRAQLAAGALKPDMMQALAAEKLESLWRALKDYRPSDGTSGWRARFGLTGRADQAPLGLYLCGGVGRGKSMLMDLFFAAVTLDRKRRVHFHAFMLEIHHRLHRWRQQSRRDDAGDDPIARVAAEIAGEAWLLCFDEFQVTNVADAVVLGRLLDALFQRGVVMVVTSNSAPEALYPGGLQRELFLPAIDLINHRLDVLELAGELDYRRRVLTRMAVYFMPLGEAASDALRDAFHELTEGAESAPEEVIVQGRRLIVARAARGVARSTFVELCERPLGPADYLALATHFHTLILDGVPRLDPERRDEARRFMTLVDALYEHRAKLICAAAGEPEQIYPAGDHAKEFERTASRLHEMRSEAYLLAPHLT